MRNQSLIKSFEKLIYYNDDKPKNAQLKCYNLLTVILVKKLAFDSRTVYVRLYLVNFFPNLFHSTIFHISHSFI